MTVSWRDIDINLSQGNDGDIKAMTEVDAIKNSLTNLFVTMKGSRRMMPDAFIDIYRILFEPMDERTAMRLGSMLVEVIEKYETRIDVENLNVEQDYNNNQYNITLTFVIKNTTQIEVMDYVISAR